MLDLRHASKMEQIETALAALDLRPIGDVAKAAKGGKVQRTRPE